MTYAKDLSDYHHTVDGVRISPGLRVWSNDLKVVIVDPKQFELAEQLHNKGQHSRFGGQYWDGWYDTSYPDGTRGPSLNGTRMITVYDNKKA
jgi:hypothetical protein